MSVSYSIRGTPAANNLPVPNEAALAYDFVGGVLWGSSPDTGAWIPLSAVGGSSPVLTARVTITAAQVIAANGAAPTPNFPVIIPAPGAGKLLNPINIFLEWKSGVAMNVGSGTFEFSVYNAAKAALLYWMGNVATAGFFNTTGITILSNSSTVGDEAEVPFNDSSPSIYANMPLVFVAEDELSGGTGGTLTVTVLYNIITMA